MAFVQKYYDMNKNECDEIINQITQFFASKENREQIKKSKNYSTFLVLHEEFANKFSYNFINNYRVFLTSSINRVAVVKNYFPIDPKPSDLFMNEMIFDVRNEKVTAKEIKYQKKINKLSDINQNIYKKSTKQTNNAILNVAYTLNNKEQVEIEIFVNNNFTLNVRMVVDKNKSFLDIESYLASPNIFLIDYSKEEQNYIYTQITHLYKAFQQNNSIITQTLLDYVLTGKSFVFDQEIIDEMKLRHDLNVCSMEEIELFESVIVNNKILNKNR